MPELYRDSRWNVNKNTGIPGILIYTGIPGILCLILHERSSILDEIWSFVYAKVSNVPKKKRGQVRLRDCLDVDGD